MTPSKFIAVSMVLMSCITLYTQAATNFTMELRVSVALLGAFMLLATLVVLGIIMLPLKQVIEGTSELEGRRERALSTEHESRPQRVLSAIGIADGRTGGISGDVGGIMSEICENPMRTK